MVMKYRALSKNIRQAIRRSMGRYIAIVAIIALGAGIFVGLRSTKTDMVATGQKYTDEQNMFDLRLLSSYGWDDKDLETIAAMEGIDHIEGMVNVDAIVNVDGDDDSIFRFHAIPSLINRVRLMGGRMPEKEDECLADGFLGGEQLLGKQITISQSNTEETQNSFTCRTYTVVGYVSTPLYLDMERGTTSIGKGSITSYLYILPDGFALDYYTEIGVTIPGKYAIYSDAYTLALDAAAERLEAAITPVAQQRLERLRKEAQEAYDDGMAEYEDGLRQYYDGKFTADRELAEGKKKLEDAQKELEDNRKLLEDAKVQLEDGQKLLDEKARELEQARQALEYAKAEAYAQLAQAEAELEENYRMITENLQQLEDGLQQLEDGLAQINEGIGALEDGLAQIDDGIRQIDILLGLLDTGIRATQAALDFAKLQPVVDERLVELLQKQLDELLAQRAEYAATRQQLVDTREEYAPQLEQLKAQKGELEAQKAELETVRQTLVDALADIDAGFEELERSRIQAEEQFADARAQIEDGQAQLLAAQQELDEKKAELEATLPELEDAQRQIDEGWTEYESGKLEAQTELEDAWQKLLDAKAQLADGKKTIDAMTETSVYALTRNTNSGYLSLDSTSNIVAGISKVFPVFFLLVAALICMTTMSRMVNEERTEIGTLKAMGYSNRAIISKYLLYSGSAALLGSLVGVLLGSIVFPVILWRVYCIMFYITPNVELRFDWLLCGLVITVYCAAMMAVSWYTCRRELQEVPAELIRPKAPDPGKKILLERIPVWSRLSFLNKVMLRNIFRYRQRLLMMLMGIGGCTALLVAGFGIRDSIANVVDYQFEEVTVYDMEVYFSGDRTLQQQEAFAEALAGKAENLAFYHQRSVELDFDGASRDLYMIVCGEELTSFIDLHKGARQLPIPGVNEALISSGAAGSMGIKPGDTITLRDSDLNLLTVQVSGVYDNFVQNFVILSPETMQSQWGQQPQLQMAFVKVADGQDVHTVAAYITGLEDVMSVMVCQDTADLIGTMLEAMDLVVITVVICAGLLAMIVMYNLTNINIKERIREIATIKVLGFRAGETAAYVFKENVLLSIWGAILGLPAGKLLLDFIMRQIKIDMVWFQSRVTWMSLLVSVGLTLLLGALVDIIFYFRLDKINMAEALKSVE